MPNPFDQFDAPAQLPTGNPFDQFDGPSKQTSQELTIPQQIVGGLKHVVNNYLGIPSGEIKNDRGEVVFPTNALERGLRGADPAGKEFAAAFVGGPSIRGNLPRVAAPNVKAAATAVYDDPFNRSVPVHELQRRGAVTDFKNDFKTYDPQAKRYKSLSTIVDEIDQPGHVTVDQLDKWSTRLWDEAKPVQTAPGVYETPPAAAAALNLKSKIDDLVKGAVPEWATADANYTAARGAEQLSKRTIKEAIRSEGRGMPFADRMQNAATQFRLDPRTQATLSPQQMSMLEGIQKGFPVLDTIKGALPGGVAGAVTGFTQAGPVGGMVGYGIGKAAHAAESGLINALKNRSAGKQSDALIQSLLQNSPYGKSLPPNIDLATKQAIARALLYPNARSAFGAARADED